MGLRPRKVSSGAGRARSDSPPPGCGRVTLAVMRWFDTHAHLDVLDRGELERARAVGVDRVVVPGVVGCDPAVAALAAAEPGVQYTVGWHPLYLDRVSDIDAAVAALEAPLRTDPRCVGLGEIGLDFLAADEPARDRQRAMLAAQLALADELGCPVVVHLRKGWAEFLETARRRPRLAWVMHMFSGAPDIAAALRAALPRLWFGFGGPAARADARKPVAVLRATPPEQILLETDAPDLAPRELGAPNTPANLPWIGARLAERRGIPTAELAALAYGNAERAFAR
jgi:TatD DNase family protein